MSVRIRAIMGNWKPQRYVLLGRICTVGAPRFVVTTPATRYDRAHRAVRFEDDGTTSWVCAARFRQRATYHPETPEVEWIAAG